jgi:hypothetical protein
MTLKSPDKYDIVVKATSILFGLENSGRQMIWD